MPLTPNNEPQPPKRRNGLGWLLPLLIAAPTIINVVRRRTAGVLTDEQLLMIVAGVGALVVLAIVARRAMSSQSAAPRPPQYDVYKPSTLPQAPRYEPMITGKVLAVGVALGTLFALGILALAVVL